MNDEQPFLFTPEDILPAVSLIKKIHTFNSEPYLNVDRLWAVGYGHTRTVRAGMKIEIQQAEELLCDDLKTYAFIVRGAVTVPLNLHQFNALVVFCAHIGETCFKRSNLLRLLNRGWYDQVPTQLKRWSQKGEARHKARRQAEADLWRME